MSHPNAAPVSDRLVAFLRNHRDEILARWEKRVRASSSARRLSGPALRDQIPAILEAVERRLAGRPSQAEEPARRHGEERASEDFSIEEAFEEIFALRDATLEIRAEAAPLEGEEAARLARAFDGALAASVRALASAHCRIVRERTEESAQLEALFDSAPVGLSFWDRDLRFVRINSWLAEVNGLPVEAHLGRRPDELLPDVEGIDDILAGWVRILETGEPWLGVEVEGKTPAAPGVRRTWREDFFPVRAAGKVVGVGGVVVETTEQRRAEAQLMLLARVGVELAEVVICGEDALARIARLAVPEMGDWCAAVLAGDGRAPRRVAVEGIDPSVVARVRRLLESGDSSAPCGLERVLRDGTPELLAVPSVATCADEQSFLQRIEAGSCVCVPLLARGRILGAMGFGLSPGRRRHDAQDLAFAMDLARRCALALDNARLLDEARTEARLREGVLAVVSHDLRNPLSTVVLSASGIAAAAPEGAAGERIRRGADAIRRAGERMTRLIGDLLDATAIESGQLSIELAPHAPAELLVEAAQAFRADTLERGISIQIGADPELPPVRADRDRVLQVLSNLLSNAMKVTREGGRITLRAAPAGGEVVFEVSDTGPGIPEPERARIFEPYERGASPGYVGTGLGLAIARGIVEAHGGRIWVSEGERPGATFAFTLPVVDEREHAETGLMN